MEFMLFVVAVIGFTHIMVHSSFMDPFRTWAKIHFPEKVLWFHPREMVECYQCMGTWCGWALGVLFAFFLLNTGWLASLVIAFFCGFAGSFLASLAADVSTWLQANSVVEIKKEDN
jgi:hypothetical protein